MTGGPARNAQYPIEETTPTRPAASSGSSAAALMPTGKPGAVLWGLGTALGFPVGMSAAADDPHVKYRYGRLATRVRAAEALLRDAAATLDRIGLVPADADAAARGSLAVAAAKAFGSEVAVEAASELFALCGTSSTAAKYDLDRHWRNARTHSVHDPADWKYHHIAGYELSDVRPPNHGQL